MYVNIDLQEINVYSEFLQKHRAWNTFTFINILFVYKSVIYFCQNIHSYSIINTFHKCSSVECWTELKCALFGTILAAFT